MQLLYQLNSGLSLKDGCTILPIFIESVWVVHVWLCNDDYTTTWKPACGQGNQIEGSRQLPGAIVCVCACVSVRVCVCLCVYVCVCVIKKFL